MPFTLFHWGFVFLLYIVFPLDPISLLITSVVQDIEPVSILFLLSGNLPLHGPIHSLTLGIPIGLLSGLIINTIYTYIQQKWNQRLEKSFSKKLPVIELRTALITGAIGTLSHSLLDAFLYIELPLFWPLEGNTLYNFFPLNSYCLCIGAFLIGWIIVIFNSPTGSLPAK